MMMAMMVMMFYYFYSLSLSLSLSFSLLSFSLWFTFGSPLVILRFPQSFPLSFFSLSLSPFRGSPSSNVGFINVNVVKYLQRYFNIEIGTLFVYDFY